jgi:hypothetical protein
MGYRSLGRVEDVYCESLQDEEGVGGDIVL